MWLSLLTSKLGLSLIATIAIGGAGFYVKHLIEDRALLERDLEDRELALESVATEFSQYALNSEAVIDAYNVNNEILQKDYQESRDLVSNSIERANKHDYQKILNSHPDAFIKRANDATAKLFENYEEISKYPKNNTNRDKDKTSVP